MTPDAAYGKLTDRSREVALLSTTNSVLGWDQETHMPPKAVAYRAEQSSYLVGFGHKLATAPEVGEWLAACENAGWGEDDERRANVREWRRDYDRATKTPPDLVTELARVTALARDAWQDARRKKDFVLFHPWLEKIVALSRRQADCWGWQGTRYNALLDAYEPGANADELTKLFTDLRGTLTGLLPAAQKRTAAVDPEWLRSHYPIAAQQELNKQIAQAMGFDFESGRIDTTTHPFCSGMGPKDCRLTTRYDEADFTSSLFGIMHEAGHGLYEQGLREDKHGTPLGEAASLGIHESQSRLWENQVGRSRAFWQHWYPKARQLFPALEQLEPEDFWTIINRVEPSHIRTESDEVTYNLHIILRFKLERGLIEGTLAPADVPLAWNEEFEELFDLDVPDAAHGCLQDIHWSLGGIGYFPTYTLGNLNAAQLYHAALVQNPSLETGIAQGEYGQLLGWLRTNVHAAGRRYAPSELMRRATGEATNAKHFGDYLKKKFAA